MAEVDVSNKVLCPSGEELVRGCEVPWDAANIGVSVSGGAGDGGPGRLTEGTVEDEVVEGVIGPATGARELVKGDVWPETGCIVRREGVANGEPEGSGGGVPGVTGHAATGVGVLVRGHGGRPEGVVGAVGGMSEGVLVSILRVLLVNLYHTSIVIRTPARIQPVW